jgi:hypothetical protein
LSLTAPYFQYDVFISYSHKDQDWVRNTLLPTLEKNGVKVIIDYRDFEPGAPSITEMERAVKDSRTEFEALLLGTLDPAGRERKILPILLEKCDLPLRINYLIYLNFTEPTYLDLQWTKLISVFSKTPSKIPTKLIEPPQLKKENAMSAYSSVNMQTLRKILMECNELSTDERLQALFTDPRLSPFRSNLPEATSRAERVDLLGAYLIGRKFSSGEFLLAVFLKVLHEKTPAQDARLQNIEVLMSTLGIPVSTKMLAASPVAEKSPAISPENLNKYFEIIQQYRHNLLVVEEQIALFVDPRNVPPDLKIARSEIIKRVHELEVEISSQVNLPASMALGSNIDKITNKDLMDRLYSLERVLGGQIEEFQIDIRKQFDEIKMGQAFIYQRIQPIDKELIQRILEEVHQGRIEQGEIQHALDAVRRVFKHIIETGVKINDPQISKALADIYQSVNSNLCLEEKFELSIPIIPLLLNYQLSLGGAVDLQAVWKELISRFTGNRGQ